MESVTWIERVLGSQHDSCPPDRENVPELANDPRCGRSSLGTRTERYRVLTPELILPRQRRGVGLLDGDAARDGEGGIPSVGSDFLGVGWGGASDRERHGGQG